MFRKNIKSPFFYRKTFILFLTLCSVSMQGQSTITATELLSSAYQSPNLAVLQDQIAYQALTDYTLPVIQEMEIRTELNSFDWAEQEFTLRAKFNTKRQRRAQDEFHSASSTANSLTLQVEIKEAITNRYQWLVRWLEVAQSLEAKKALKSLYQDQLIYLQRMVGDIDFDIKDLVKAEEEVLDITYDIIKIQNQKERLKANLKVLTNGIDSVIINKEAIISNEQILKVLEIGNLDSTQHSELARREGRLDLLEKEKEIELSELNNPLTFAQIKLDDYERDDFVNEYVSIGFSFKLPFKGDKKLDLNKFELEKIEETGKIEQLKQKLLTEQNQLKTNIKQLFEQKKHLEEQQENSQAKYVLERLLELEDAKPLDILKLKEILAKRQQRTQKLDFEILKAYVQWLNASDKIMETPRRNHLLVVPELIINN